MKQRGKNIKQEGRICKTSLIELHITQFWEIKNKIHIAYTLKRGAKIKRADVSMDIFSVQQLQDNFFKKIAS